MAGSHAGTPCPVTGFLVCGCSARTSETAKSAASGVTPAIDGVELANAWGETGHQVLRRRLSRVSWNLSGGPPPDTAHGVGVGRPPRHHQEGDHRDPQVQEEHAEGECG